MDRLGNVLAYAKVASATTPLPLRAVYDYDAFGRELRSSGPAADLVPFHFSTKFTDLESGLNYYGYRYYDPGKGRWLSRDPGGETGGAVLYHAVDNNLVNAIDYLGLFDCDTPCKTQCDKLRKGLTLHPCMYLMDCENRCKNWKSKTCGPEKKEEEDRKDEDHSDDHTMLPNWLVNLGGGFGDGWTFGGTKAIRASLDCNEVDTESGFYSGGRAMAMRSERSSIVFGGGTIISKPKTFM